MATQGKGCDTRKGVRHKGCDTSGGVRGKCPGVRADVPSGEEWRERGDLCCVDRRQRFVSLRTRLPNGRGGEGDFHGLDEAQSPGSSHFSASFRKSAAPSHSAPIQESAAQHRQSLTWECSLDNLTVSFCLVPCPRAVTCPGSSVLAVYCRFTVRIQLPPWFESSCRPGYCCGCLMKT